MHDVTIGWLLSGVVVIAVSFLVAYLNYSKRPIIASVAFIFGYVGIEQNLKDAAGIKIHPLVSVLICILALGYGMKAHVANRRRAKTADVRRVLKTVDTEE